MTNPCNHQKHVSCPRCEASYEYTVLVPIRNRNDEDRIIYDAAVFAHQVKHLFNETIPDQSITIEDPTISDVRKRLTIDFEMQETSLDADVIVYVTKYYSKNHDNRLFTATINSRLYSAVLGSKSGGQGFIL